MLHSAMSQSESPASALLRVAEYLSRPPHFLAVAEARAAFRHTLELVHQASVVLTTNGEPAAALVPFATLEAMRGALLHLLVREMEASFAQMQAQIARESQDTALTSDEDFDALVGEVLRRARGEPVVRPDSTQA
jgi:PHD/YefM family antitoxin component YafN of YafNO toxin-antitoxin module